VTGRLRILVAGMVAGVPAQGGAAWAVLQYVLGLRALGHDVIAVECTDAPLEEAAPRFLAVMSEFRLERRCAIVERATGRTAGLGRRALLDAAAGADLMLNLSGVCDDEEVLARVPVRAYVDLDPGFTQVWALDPAVDLGLERHDRFVTIGRAIGSPGCALPTGGRSWVTTPQPIVLDHWPVAGAIEHRALTTVAHWRSYGSLHHRGLHLGQKAHALRPLLDLPRRAAARCILALGIHPDERDDLDALHRFGWRLLDPSAVAGTPAAYRRFVGGSWAELGVAKLGYVATRCGWFSDRSLCYLASGRPVIAQDTGFGSWLPTGAGVLAFRNADDVGAAIEALRCDYPAHRRAARELAASIFAADRVLPELLACL
jgi:hypothetical protein